MWCKRDLFSKMGVLVLFCARGTAYIVRDNAKTLTSIDLSYKDVIIFSKKLLERCSLHKIK